jgi:hypothetical protein
LPAVLTVRATGSKPITVSITTSMPYFDFSAS